MKKFFLFFIVLTIMIVTTTACKNKVKQPLNAKQSSKNLVKSLDFSYFPAESTVLAIVDFQSIFSVKAFRPMLVKFFDEIKKTTEIDISELKSISAFVNIRNLKNNPLSNAAVIIDGIDITKMKNFPKAIKTEKFEGLNINIYDDKTGFVIVDGKTIGGTLISVKNAISLNKGKSKNLASTPRNNDFKDIIAQLNGSQLSLAFVSNEKTDAEIKKYSEMPQFMMLKTFFNDFKSAGIGVKIDDKNIDFIIIAKSSKEGAKTLATLANTQFIQFKPMIDNQLKLFQSKITTKGVEIIKNIIASLKIKENKEFISIKFTLTMKDAMKIPEIFMSLGLGYKNRAITK